MRLTHPVLVPTPSPAPPRPQGRAESRRCFADIATARHSGADRIAELRLASLRCVERIGLVARHDFSATIHALGQRCGRGVKGKTARHPNLSPMTRWLPYAIIATFLAGTTLTVARVPTITEPVPGNSILTFPVVDGMFGRLLLRLISPAPSGTVVTLATTTAVSGLPIPKRLPKPSHLVVAFTMQVSRPIRAVTFPQWRIGVPRRMTLEPPYGIDVYVTTAGAVQWRESYAASAKDSMIVTQPRTCPNPAVNGIGCPAEQYVPGSTYIFEVLQNPPLSQVPRPSTPRPR